MRSVNFQNIESQILGLAYGINDRVGYGRVLEYKKVRYTTVEMGRRFYVG